MRHDRVIMVVYCTGAVVNQPVSEGAISFRAFIPILPILAASIAVGIAYSVTAPILEAPDESSHVAMVRYLADHHALPVQRPPEDFPAGQEGSEPPLYYTLGAALFSLSPSPAVAPTFRERNPEVNFSRQREPRSNRNLYAHTPRESFPYRGDVLGIHLVRLLGVALGALTVLLTFLIARCLFPRRPFVVLLAPALVAFNPEFGFISGVVNDDNGIAVAATIAFWLLVGWMLNGGSTRRAIALGLAIGLALLTKFSGLLLLPLAAVVVLADGVVAVATPADLPPTRIVAHQNTSRSAAGRILHSSVQQALTVGLVAVIVAGWWFVRNQIIYGDPLGWNAMLAAVAPMVRPSPLSIPAAVTVLWNARGTFWGTFGWTNVFYPAQTYRWIDVGCAIAGTGLVVAVGRCLTPSPSPDRLEWRHDSGARRLILARALLVVWPVAVWLSLVHWVQINNAADQWRLFFPAIAATAVLLAIGIDEIVLGPWRLWRAAASRSPGRAKHAIVGGSTVIATPSVPTPIASLALAIGLAALGLALNGIVLRREIIPIYYPTVSKLATAPARPFARFGTAVDLVSYRVSPVKLTPGVPIKVDLTWRARRPMRHNWSVSVSLIGSDGRRLARVQSWPQGGRAPTTAWTTGQVFHDHDTLIPQWTAASPQLGSIWVNLFDATVPGGPSLPVADPTGHPIGSGAKLTTVVLRPTETPAPPTHALDLQFAAGISLVGYDVSQTAQSIRLTLHWKSAATVTTAYTVFAHVAMADGRIVAQEDAPPNHGQAPTTIWQAGDQILDEHVISLTSVPPGSYGLVIGLYQPDTGARLAVLRTDGRPVDHNAVTLLALDLPRP